MQFNKSNWILIMGLIWGAFMFIIMAIVYPLLMGGKITLTSIVIGLIIWTLAGLGWGYLMKKYYLKKKLK